MNDIISLAKRHQEIENDLTDGNYKGEYLEEVVSALSRELLNRIGQMDYDEVTKALRNMYFLGKTVRYRPNTDV